jgi:hypothetical protein
VVAGVLVCALGTVQAQPAPEPPPETGSDGSAAPPPPPAPEPAPPAPEPAPPVVEHHEPAFRVPAFQVHGFVGEGGFVSTANNYIGDSSRGSLAMFEAGLNVSTQLSDHLRVGMQLYGRNAGQFRDLPPRLDWAYLDYHWKSWLGLRAGIIKMPFGLYNEYADIDAARTQILMPQSVYPLRDRSALLAQTGFSLYGFRPLGRHGGSLEYQAWLGTLDVPSNALEVNGGTLDSINTRYVTGAQLFWKPIDELKIGGSYVRLSIDYNVTLSEANLAALIMAGAVPADYDGRLVISQRPVQLWLASAQYTPDNWLFAAEYGRNSTRQVSTLPLVLPTTVTDGEGFYAMATHRLSSILEVGAYYSVLFADVHDRGGHNKMKFAERWYAWQRDAALTIRYDVNEHWLWKVEGHFIDGVADLFASQNAKPERYWGMVLFKTGVTF